MIASCLSSFVVANFGELENSHVGASAGLSNREDTIRQYPYPLIRPSVHPLVRPFTGLSVRPSICLSNSQRS